MKQLFFIRKWQLVFLYIGRMDWGAAGRATSIFVYWSDGLGSRGQGIWSSSRNGGRGICQQKLPAGPGMHLTNFMQMSGVWRGMLSTEIEIL